MKMHSSICLLFALFVASSLAVQYSFNNKNGGSWQTASNWSPEGVPGASDDVLFPYIDYMDSQADLTIDGDITVNSMTVEHYAYVFKSGSLVVQNACKLTAGWYIGINMTFNGDTAFNSTGSGEAGVLCDSCVMNVKKSLVITSYGGNMLLSKNAMLINNAGASTAIVYGSLKVDEQVATLVNYGTLIFQTVLATYPNTPYGDPPIAETGPWKSLQNYGEIRIQVDGSPVGVPVYNDIRTFDFSAGKMSLRMVQDSTASEDTTFDTNYEYNDAISSGGQHNYYEVFIGGDVHIVFAQAQTKPGESERPFNPQVGDFFPVFANFHKVGGNFKTVTFEGLGSGMSLGRKSIKDPLTFLTHTGVVICASSDSACINNMPNMSAGNMFGLSLMAVLVALVASIF